MEPESFSGYVCYFEHPRFSCNFGDKLFWPAWYHRVKILFSVLTRTRLLAAVGIATWSLDATTKVLASRLLAAHVPQDVMGSFFRLTLTRNAFLAFSTHLPFGSMWIYGTLSGIVLTGLAWIYASSPAKDLRWLTSIALLIAGGSANLVERLAYGSVTDFLDLGIGTIRWPTFNLADVAVVLGVSILLFDRWRIGGVRGLVALRLRPDVASSIHEVDERGYR